MKTSASFYEILGSQFFRTTTEIQSALDAFDESRFVIIFLTIVGVAEIICSLALVLEEKIGKEILKSLRLEFWEKFLANNFAESDAEGSTSTLSKITSKLLYQLQKGRALFGEQFDSILSF